jgi:hypothetical protein
MIPTRGNAIKQSAVCSACDDVEYEYDHTLVQVNEPRSDTLSVWRSNVVMVGIQNPRNLYRYFVSCNRSVPLIASITRLR